ncbi:MAG TPA: cytochrome C [Gammaproteobacteria bacterium]|jgi:cytochrome c|nr:c-type cytochrome [Arenicellales bacterium]HCY14101.1 cytochrome C [Gammaproteobacteria bacterium]|tara:strand:- start:168 stop:497 length:330 start_codon:yes stop_codon:yes gene_type:complete
MKSKKVTLTTAAAVLAGILLTGTSAHALDGAALYQAKTCFACHGADANTPVMPAYPKLAGQGAVYALQQMKDIKSGARANGMSIAMKAVMQTVSDEEMEAIAQWLEGLN